MGDVINIRTGRPAPKPLQISEYAVAFTGESYRVRRAVDRFTKRGFMQIIDAGGRAVLLAPSTVPDEYVRHLIIAWRAGRNRGRADALDPDLKLEAQ